MMENLVDRDAQETLLRDWRWFYLYKPLDGSERDEQKLL